MAKNRNNNNNRNNNSNNNQSKKHSGAKMSKYTTKTGPNAGLEQIIVNGWMFRQNGGLTTFKANTTGKSQLSDKGWYGSVGVEVINKATMQKSFYWATMEKSTGKTVIADLGIVINPKAANGGYCGPF